MSAPVEEVGGGGDIGAPEPVTVADEDATGEGTGHRDDAYVGAAHFDDVSFDDAGVPGQGEPGDDVELGAVEQDCLEPKVVGLGEGLGVPGDPAGDDAG